MTAAILATVLATPLVALAALAVFRKLTTPADTGRHRSRPGVEQYRPRPAAAISGPPVVPGPGPLTEEEKRARMISVPAVRPGAHQAPLSPEVTALMDALNADDRPEMSAEVWNEAHREHWARQRVAAEGFSWDTHMAKFSGAVLPRPFLDEKTRELDHVR